MIIVPTFLMYLCPPSSIIKTSLETDHTNGCFDVLFIYCSLVFYFFAVVAGLFHILIISFFNDEVYYRAGKLSVYDKYYTN